MATSSRGCASGTKARRQLFSNRFSVHRTIVLTHYDNAWYLPNTPIGNDVRNMKKMERGGLGPRMISEGASKEDCKL